MRRVPGSPGPSTGLVLPGAHPGTSEEPVLPSQQAKFTACSLRVKVTHQPPLTRRAEAGARQSRSRRRGSRKENFPESVSAGVDRTQGVPPYTCDGLLRDPRIANKANQSEEQRSYSEPASSLTCSPRAPPLYFYCKRKHKSTRSGQLRPRLRRGLGVLRVRESASPSLSASPPTIRTIFKQERSALLLTLALRWATITSFHLHHFFIFYTKTLFLFPQPLPPTALLSVSMNQTTLGNPTGWVLGCLSGAWHSAQRQGPSVFQQVLPTAACLPKAG